jgi:hypothetical protein
LIEEIERIRESVRRTTLIQVFPDYHTSIRAPLQEALDACDEAKAKKDVEDKASDNPNFSRYEQAIKVLKLVHDKLNERLDDLRAVDKESSTDYRRQRNWAVGIGIAGIVITILLTLVI